MGRLSAPSTCRWRYRLTRQRHSSRMGCWRLPCRRARARRRKSHRFPSRRPSLAGISGRQVCRLRERSMLHGKESTVKVHDVMTAHVQCCSPSTDLAAAAVMMFEGDCGVLPVLLEHKVIGMITDRDIAVALGTRGKRAAEIPVGEAMSTTIYACDPDDDIHTALRTLRREKVRRL